MKKALAAAACAAAVLMGAAAPADALTLTSTAPSGWLGTASDPVAVLTAVEAHGDKLPPEFDERLSLALPDGTLRVMVAVSDRSAATDAFAQAATTTLRWYSDRPRFYGTVTPDQLRTLLESPRIAFVDPDHPLDFSLAISATNIRARGTDAAPAIWKFIPPTTGNRGSLESQVAGLDTGVATGKGVTAAIVDSGIDATHRDFGGWNCEPEPYQPCESRIKEATSIGHILGDDSLEPAGEPTTDLASGHGTHIAGTIAGNGFAARDASVLDADLTTYGGDGRPIGIAPQASLVSVKNGDSQAAGLYLFALDWLLANEERLGVRVVNNSYGCVGGCSFSPASAEAGAIKDLYKAGVVMVHAAGNDAGTDTGTRFSGAAQSPYTIGVANYDARNRQLASSSSRGLGTAALPDPATWTPESEPAAGLRRPDVGAPGTNIWATRNLTGGTSSGVPRQSTGDLVGGTGCCIRDYASMTGTSMATPHVVGAVTLLASACPTGTPLDYMRAVFAGANRTGVLKTGSTTAVAQAFETGYGALDVRAALEWMRTNVRACGYEPPNVAPTATIASDDAATATETLRFDAAGSTDSDGSIVSYAWDFGDGTGATGAQVSHAFARSGSYDVTLTVTDDRGATATALKTIAVANATPAAAFSAPSTLRHEAAGTFDAAGSSDRDGAIATYAWDFGDGASGTGASVQHAYTWAGDYTVRLTVTDDEGATDTSTHSVTVTDTPDSGFKRVTASGLSNHKCNATAWEFTIKPVASGEAPGSVAVTWADGSRQRVPLAGVKSKVATYRTTQSLGEIATRAWADLPSASGAAFALASGPCQ